MHQVRTRIFDMRARRASGTHLRCGPLRTHPGDLVEQSGRVGCRAASSRESWKAIIGPHAQGRVSAAPVAATARSPSFFHLRSLSAHHVIELVTAVSSMANMLSQMKMIT